MKQTIIKKQIALFIAILCLLAVSPVMAISQHTTDTSSSLLADKFVGGWSYTVEGAPEGYKKGLLVIVKEGDSYKVQVQTGGGTILGDNVKVSGSTISFDVMVEGGKVAVSLTAKGATITGKSTSSEGSYTIKGEKTISMD
ncbi:hypothetical protein [Pricia antarctica]|nr:hypothetical protein [Pricia antarctica]